ncbi:MAG: NUDIX hydrolase [Ferruginibacter sp.]
MIQKWTLLKEEDVSPSKWMPVLRHTVQLPGNKIVDDYYLTRLGNVAVVLAITTNNQAVLIRQYKHGTGEVLLELPGGMQHKHATMEQCAVAELQEETGIQVIPEQLLSLGKVAGNAAKTDQVTYGYLVKNVSFNSSRQLDHTEEIELVLVSPKELISMIASGEIWVSDTVALVLKARLLYPDLFE